MLWGVCRIDTERGMMFKKIIDLLRWWYHAKRRLTALAIIVQETEQRFKDVWEQVERLRSDSVSHDQIKALQLIDENWHDQGKIILAFHTEQGDRIKIIDVKRKTTMKEYIQLVKGMEAEYGVQPKYADSAMPPRDWFRLYREGRWD